jgi:hypothetical protein
MLRVHYAGWSTFRLEVEGGPTLVIDPCISALLDDPHAEPEDCVGDVVLLTHGHHEHIRDAHRIARFHSGPFVAPPQVVDYLCAVRHFQPSRLVRIEPNETIELDGFRVTAREFPHLEKHDAAGKLAILKQDNPLGAPKMLARHALNIALSYLVIRRQPEHGPFLAYDLEYDGGPRVFFTCEAFTKLLDPEIVRGWGEGDRPVDLAIVGVESSHEEAAAALTDALAPRRAIAAAIHAPFERFYGKPPVEGARWVAGRSERTFWTPGRRERFPLHERGFREY